MKKLLSVLAAIVFATPAFAAVQNVKVSGDIDSTYISRDHFNLGARLGAGSATPFVQTGLESQSAFITQTRLRVDADLSDNVSTTVGLINERAWDAETTAGASNNIQLYLAYATMREFLYSPLTVSVGRQVFNYGNGLIIGDGGPNNSTTAGTGLATVAADLTKRTSYDGVKAILDYKPLTLDLIYFKNSSGTTNSGGIASGVANTTDDSDVFGLNANYQLGDAMNTVVEGYFFSRINGKTNVAGSNQGDTLYVPGLRLSTNPIKGLNTQAEVAWQAGTKSIVDSGFPAGGDNQHRQAFAYQLMASYTVPMMEKYKPMVNASFTHVSGDKTGSVNSPLPGNGGNRSGETYSAWDPLNEAQGSGTIYNSIFSLTNMNIVSAGATITPLEDITANFTWSGLWADRRYTNGATSNNVLTLVQPDGSTAVTPAVNGRKDLGNEYDVNVNYAYTEDVTFGVSLGWFVAGKAFTGANDDTAKQALAHVLVNF